MPRWEEDVKRLKANDPSLTTLNLNDNSIGNVGAKAIAEALKVNTVLTKLYLGDNSIGDNLLNDINKLVDANKNRNAIAAILSKMQMNEQNADIQIKCCSELWDLALNENNRVTISDAGGKAVIESALRNYSSNAGVQEKGKAALRNLNLHGKWSLW